ncbi:esterase/lipase family protein [Halobacteriales archaeon Cl-PHB]
MTGHLATATTLVGTSSRWLSGVLHGSIDVDPRSRTDDSFLPWNTGGAYGGLSGTHVFRDLPRRQNVPTVFVHGNTADASIWTGMMEAFLEAGDTGEDLWSITFRRSSPSHAEMADQIDAFVARVRDHTGHDEVHVVAHSLGVTGARHWLAEYDRYDWVGSFVGLAGANHGSSRCKRLARSQVAFGPARTNRILSPDRLDDPDSFLSALNANETPGDVDYYTLRATDDRFFRANPESPRLEGATNRALETSHVGLVHEAAAHRQVYDWLRGD